VQGTDGYFRASGLSLHRNLYLRAGSPGNDFGIKRARKDEEGERERERECSISARANRDDVDRSRIILKYDHTSSVNLGV